MGKAISIFGDKMLFDFTKLIPPPVWLYRGDMGNMHTTRFKDPTKWVAENWGTTRNAYSTSAAIDLDTKMVTMSFVSAWTVPYMPIVAFANTFGYPFVHTWGAECDDEIGFEVWGRNKRTDFLGETSEWIELVYAETANLDFGWNHPQYVKVFNLVYGKSPSLPPEYCDVDKADELRDSLTKSGGKTVEQANAILAEMTALRDDYGRKSIEAASVGNEAWANYYEVKAAAVYGHKTPRKTIIEAARVPPVVVAEVLNEIIEGKHAVVPKAGHGWGEDCYATFEIPSLDFSFTVFTHAGELSCVQSVTDGPVTTSYDDWFSQGEAGPIIHMVDIDTARLKDILKNCE